MSRKEPNIPKLIEASRALLDWIYIFGLPGDDAGRDTFAAMLNELDTAAGARVSERVGGGSQESQP